MSGLSTVSTRTTRLLPVLCLSLLLVLTGCVGLVFDEPQERPVTAVLNNSANSTFTFKVSVVELPANLTTRREDGLTGTGPIGQGGGTHEPGVNYSFTAVELPDSAYLHGRYTLEPGKEKRTNISPSDFASKRETFPRRFAVVVVVYHDKNEDEIIEYTTVNCDEADLTGLKVTSRHIKAKPDIWLVFNCG